jgi:hypothetical protein
MADGQLGYSPGHFAHIARNESSSPFNNVTIELLKPQGEPRNLCEKIVDGPLNGCQNSGSSTLPPDSPLRALAKALAIKQLFETEEIFVTSHSIALKQSYSESGSQPSRLLVVEEGSELQVDIPGEPSKSVGGGEVLWLEAREKWAILAPGPHKLTRFLLIQFKGSK